MRYVLVLTALLVPSSIAAQGFFSRTCLTYQTTEYCASTSASVAIDWGLVFGQGYTPEEARSIWAGLSPWDLSLPIHPTAFAFYIPREVTPLNVGPAGESGWGGGNPAFTNLPTAWDGYHLLAGLAVNPEDRWYASGEGFEGYLNSWNPWPELDVPADMVWGWRGENEDGSVVLQCFQDPAGGDACITVTPEPATWALLASGLVILCLFARRARRVGLSA